MWGYAFTVAGDNFVEQLTALKKSGVTFYWLGAGDKDMAHDGTVALPSEVRKMGFETSCTEIPGIHYCFIWRQFLTDSTPLLFR